jgi:prolyl oligopeptidase
MFTLKYLISRPKTIEINFTKNYVSMKKSISKLKIAIIFSFLFLFSIIQSCQRSKEIKNDLKYPVLNFKPVINDYFGKKVVDKYRMMEDLDSEEVKRWLQAEKRMSDSVLLAIPNRKSFQKELEFLMHTSNIRGDLPRTSDNKIFFMRKYLKEGSQKIFYMDSVSSKEVELFSTQSISNDSLNFNIDYFNPSYDGKYLAIGISCNGNENSVIYIMDVEKKILLPDRIERAMGGNPNWLKNKRAFFYQQLKEIKTDDDLKTRNEDSKVKLHFVGTDSKNDKDVFSRTHDPNLYIDKLDFPLIYTFPSSDKVLAVINHGSQAYAALYYTSIEDVLDHLDMGNSTWKNICSFGEKVKSYGLKGDDVFLLTYDVNQNGSLEKRALQKPKQREIILKGTDGILDDMIQTKNALYIKIIKSGISIMKRVDLNNLKVKDIKLEYDGSIDIKQSWEVTPAYLHSKNIFVGLTSWTKEWAVYYYNEETEELTKTNIRPPGDYGDNSELIVKELEIPSKDGTMIPLSIIYSKKIHLNGQNPTLLYGYGAYGISINSFFNPSLLAWFKEGGIYAVAHVRGGGEKGDAWYKDGYKATKPNSWKDFITCAEYLIKNNYTSSEKLSAEGESAGSITVGRAITERPDLFKAAIISVGVLNTIRSENGSSTANIAEFGTTRNPMEFKYLYEMDTYHHIKEGIVYPSILFTAGINDARVDIWQPAKAVAAMQNLSIDQKNVILFKITDGGHFGDDDYMKELTDKYLFLLWQLRNPLFTNVKN